MIKRVGNTPLVRLNNLPLTFDIKCHVFVKCEFLNPTGNVSDRLVLQQFKGAPKDVLLSTGHVISHGDPETCLSSSWLASVGNLRSVTLPDDAYKTDPEFEKLMKALGNQKVSMTEDDHEEIYSKGTSEEIDEALSNKFYVTSHLNPENVATAYTTVGQEIKNQLEDLKPNMIVCSNESEGAVLYGVTMRMRTEDDEEATNEVVSVGVDLSENRFYKEPSSKTMKEPAKQVPFEWSHTTESGDGATSQDISAVKKNLEMFSKNSEMWRNRSEVNKFVKSSDAASYFTARRLIREEGLLVGPKAGAVTSAALKEITNNPELRDNEDAVVVLVLSGSLWNDSQDFLSDEWMLENKYFKKEKMESLYWWYNMPVMTVKSQPVVEFPSDTNVTQAIEALRELKVGKGLVVDPESEESKPLGVVSIELLECLDDEDKNKSLGSLCCSNLGVVDSNANLSEVVPLLEKHAFVLIVQKSPTVKSRVGNDGIDSSENTSEDGSPADNDEEESSAQNKDLTENGNTEGLPESDSSTFDVSNDPEIEMEFKEFVLGILDMRDLIIYQNELEAHHEKHYGIRLSDGIPSCDWYDDFE